MLLYRVGSPKPTAVPRWDNRLISPPQWDSRVLPPRAASPLATGYSQKGPPCQSTPGMCPDPLRLLVMRVVFELG